MKMQQAAQSRFIKYWLRGVDLNHRPLGYEPNELPDCSTPQFDGNKAILAGQTDGLSAVFFQNSHDSGDGVPISRSCGHAEQFVNLAEIADGFHLAAIHSQHK